MRRLRHHAPKRRQRKPRLPSDCRRPAATCRISGLLQRKEYYVPSGALVFLKLLQMVFPAFSLRVSPPYSGEWSRTLAPVRFVGTHRRRHASRQHDRIRRDRNFAALTPDGPMRRHGRCPAAYPIRHSTGLTGYRHAPPRIALTARSRGVARHHGARHRFACFVPRVLACQPSQFSRWASSACSSTGPMAVISPAPTVKTTSPW